MTKYLNVKELYKVWSKEYDDYPNPLIWLEEQVVPLLIGNVRGKEVLDIGCGTGRYSIELANKGAKVTAVDFCKPMLKIAKRKAGKLDIRFVYSDLKKIPLRQKFDIVICNLVLSHVEDLGNALKEVSRLVKRGGFVIISDCRTNFLKRKKKRFKLYKRFTTDNYRHTFADYFSAFKMNKLLVEDFREIKFGKKAMKKFPKYFFLRSRVIGYVFRLVKK